MKAKFNGNLYSIFENLSINTSSKQLTFSDVEIDFTGETIDDLPIKWQEVQILDNDDVTVLFTGYCGDIDVEEFDGQQKKLKLKLSLMSPMALTTVKTITIGITNEPLNEAIVDILKPLTDEGFTIEVNELSTVSISKIYNFKTVEEVLNELSNRYRFAWFIDASKKIYMKKVSFIENEAPIVSKLEDFPAGYKLKPKISPVDYANVVNAKNQNILQFKTQLENVELPLNQTIQFEYPISFSKNSGAKVTTEQENTITGAPTEIAMLTVVEDTGGGQLFNSIDYVVATNEITFDIGIGIDGIDNNKAGCRYLLTTDPNNQTLATGIKVNTNNIVGDLNLDSVSGFGTVVSTTTLYNNPAEVTKNKGKVSITGKIEKTINFNGQFLTKFDTLNFAKNRLLRTNKQTDELVISMAGLDRDDFKEFVKNVTPLNRIALNEPDYFTVGDFIITNTTVRYKPNYIEFTIKCRNTNLIENYMDIYRRSDDTEDIEIADNIYSVLIDEDIIERKVTLIDGVIVDDNTE